MISADEERRRIDDLDRTIIDILRQRESVSRCIQDARCAGGGPRLDQDRERVVVERYRAAFDEPGTQLGEAVLRICRSR